MNNAPQVMCTSSGYHGPKCCPSLQSKAKCDTVLLKLPHQSIKDHRALGAEYTFWFSTTQSVGIVTFRH